MRQFQPVKARLHIDFDATAEFERFFERVLDNIRTPGIEAKILRSAMLETVLPAIRDAFLKGMPKAVDMRVIKRIPENPHEGLRAKGNPRDGAAGEMTLRGIYERMRQAQIRGDSTAMDSAREEYRKYQEPYRESLQTLPGGKKKNSHYLSSGLFRKRAMQVMDMFVNPSLLHTAQGAGAVTVGLGHLQELERIETPSATEYVLGLNKTRSRNNILWRQLEFGTGVHANKADTGFPNEKLGPGTFNRGLPGGAWYYGRSLRKARLLLEGSDGIHAIYGNRELMDASRAMLDIVGASLTRLFSGEPVQ